MSARRHIGERRHVLARELDEVRPHRVALQRDPRQIGGSILDAGDVLQLDSRAIVSTESRRPSAAECCR